MMTKMVKFIRSLNIETVPLKGRVNLDYQDYDFATPVLDTYDTIILDPPIKTHVVPIKRFVKWRRKGANDLADKEHEVVTDLYIAYSKEVEELLEFPMSSMVKLLEIKDRDMLALNQKLYLFHNAGWWSRLRYLFKRTIEGTI